MRSTRRASPSLRIISVDVGWPAGALRRGRVAQPRSLTGAHIPVRAVRVLRTPTEPRARYAPTLRAHARAPGTSTCAGGAAQLRWSRRRFGLLAEKQQRVSRTRPNRFPNDAATCAIPLRRASRASPLGLRPNTPERALGGPQAHADRDWKERSLPVVARSAAILIGRSTRCARRTPFMQNRFYLTRRHRCAKKRIKGFFEDRRTRVRAHRTRKAAPHQGLAPSARQSRVGSECSALLRSGAGRVPVSRSGDGLQQSGGGV